MTPSRFFQSIALLGCLAVSSFAQQTKPQVILLKLDDVVQRRVGSKAVSDRWLKTYDYLKANNIKGSFGIITESLEKDNPPYFQWLKDIQKEGLIEFWMHGYHLKTAQEPGEFEQGTAAEQRAILEKGMSLAKEKLGFPLPAFGPHWSGTTDATDEALEGVPDIKIWLYGPKQPKFFTGSASSAYWRWRTPPSCLTPRSSKSPTRRTPPKKRCWCCRAIPTSGMMRAGRASWRSSTF